MGDVTVNGDGWTHEPALLIGGPHHGLLVKRRTFFFTEVVRAGWDRIDPATAVIDRYQNTYAERDGVMAFVYDGCRVGNDFRMDRAGASKARAWLRRWKRDGTFPRTAPPIKATTLRDEEPAITAPAGRGVAGGSGQMEPNEPDVEAAPIIVGPFQGSHEARIADRPDCSHRRYVVCRESREVECESCGATLDAFDVLMEYATHERIWQGWEKRTREAADRVKALEAEEAKVRARVRALNGKDAKAAVEKERRDYARMLHSAEYKARQIEELAGQIGRAVRGELGRRKNGDDNAPREGGR